MTSFVEFMSSLRSMSEWCSFECAGENDEPEEETTRVHEDTIKEEEEEEEEQKQEEEKEVEEQNEESQQTEEENEESEQNANETENENSVHVEEENEEVDEADSTVPDAVPDAVPVTPRPPSALIGVSIANRLEPNKVSLIRQVREGKWSFVLYFTAQRHF